MAHRLDSFEACNDSSPKGSHDLEFSIVIAASFFKLHLVAMACILARAFCKESALFLRDAAGFQGLWRLPRGPAGEARFSPATTFTNLGLLDNPVRGPWGCCCEVFLQ